MIGIAELLLGQGYCVTGSDNVDNPMIQRLNERGASLYIGHHSDRIASSRVPDLVVVSSAIPGDNPELQAAQIAGIPIVSRAQMLAAFMRFRVGIAVSGTHGKTTVTGLLAHIFMETEQDPSFAIGGQLHAIASPVRWGSGPFFIAEADESDASFLALPAVIGVVTNIDQDHMETYAQDAEFLRASFHKFLAQLPFYGTAIVCCDDAGVQALLPNLDQRVVTYGFSEQAQVRAVGYRTVGTTGVFELQYRLGDKYAHDDIAEAPPYVTLGPIVLEMPGAHNVQNALAAISVGLVCGIPNDRILSALGTFPGVNRRFECKTLLAPFKDVVAINDYGHHPQAIQVTLETVRSLWPGRRLLMVFQPHRYSRTQALWDAFVQVLSLVDQLVLVEVYAAGEALIPGINSASLCRVLAKCFDTAMAPVYASNVAVALQEVACRIQENDIVLVQGAGDVTEIFDRLTA